MQIAPVSFAGKKEIQTIAKNAGKLNTAEKQLVDNAIKFHELEIDTTSDGDYLANPIEARNTSAALMNSLNKAGASKLSYLNFNGLILIPLKLSFCRAFKYLS